MRITNQGDYENIAKEMLIHTILKLLMLTIQTEEKLPLENDASQVDSSVIFKDNDQRLTTIPLKHYPSTSAKFNAIRDGNPQL